MESQDKKTVYFTVCLRPVDLEIIAAISRRASWGRSEVIRRSIAALAEMMSIFVCDGQIVVRPLGEQNADTPD